MKSYYVVRELNGIPCVTKLGLADDEIGENTFGRYVKFIGIEGYGSYINCPVFEDEISAYEKAKDAILDLQTFLNFKFREYDDHILALEEK